MVGSKSHGSVATSAFAGRYDAPLFMALGSSLKLLLVGPAARPGLAVITRTLRLMNNSCRSSRAHFPYRPALWRATGISLARLSSSPLTFLIDRRNLPSPFLLRPPGGRGDRPRLPAPCAHQRVGHGRCPRHRGGGRGIGAPRGGVRRNHRGAAAGGQLGGRCGIYGGWRGRSGEKVATEDGAGCGEVREKVRIKRYPARM